MDSEMSNKTNILSIHEKVQDAHVWIYCVKSEGEPSENAVFIDVGVGSLFSS